MIDTLHDWYTLGTGWIFETLLQPLMYEAGLMDWADEAFQWMDFFVFGLLQVTVVVAICLPLERWRPVERWESRRRVWTDVAYTLLARLGLLPLIGFLLFFAAQARIEGWIADSASSRRRWRWLGRGCGRIRSWPWRSTWSCWTSPLIGTTASSTGSAGGGRCIRSTTRRRR
jgi:hypothetical protein